MTDPLRVAAHYTRGNLLDSIAAGVGKLGKSPETLGIEDLAPVDEFHIGGAVATRSFLDQVGVTPDQHVLDVGCGLGGTSRFIAHTYGCRVTGIDLTQEYVDTGRALCTWVGLEERVSLVQGNALAMDFPPGTFDTVVVLHVGMNITDKGALAEEAWRALKPGGVFGIYDVMRVREGDLTFPVPWATEPESSAVASPAEYKKALSGAGFVVAAERDRSEFALDFFQRLRAEARHDQGPPALGLHLLMGEDASTKVQNMIENISLGRVAPVELIALKPE
jgi:SAM-dependent methyltransferase